MDGDTESNAKDGGLACTRAVSQVLGLQACAIIPGCMLGLCGTGDQT